MAEQSPIEKLVDAILLVSLKKRATRIRLRANAKQFVVHLEIDGTFVEEMRPPAKLRDVVFDLVAKMSADDGFIRLVSPTARHVFSVVFFDDATSSVADIRSVPTPTQPN